MKFDIQALEDAVKETVADILGVNDASEIEQGASLSEKYGFSSLDALQLIIKLEEKFDIVIPDEAIDDTLINSINSIVNYISET